MSAGRSRQRNPARNAYKILLKAARSGIGFRPRYVKEHNASVPFVMHSSHPHGGAATYAQGPDVSRRATMFDAGQMDTYRTKQHDPTWPTAQQRRTRDMKNIESSIKGFNSPDRGGKHLPLGVRKSYGCTLRSQYGTHFIAEFPARATPLQYSPCKHAWS
jgi:hypothetical protein